MECNDNYTPEFSDEEPCEQISASCVILEEAIAYLGLSANTPINEVFIAMVLSLQDARNRITQLENNQ